MTPLQTIAVTGATGAQGGGLVRAILAHPEAGFAARAITRDPGSPAARALAAEGVEVVRADLDDRESLQAAFAGAHGAFCVTNFWEHFSPERELAQAANLAAAARAAGVRHAVWSTLEDTREWIPLDDGRLPVLMGRYNVPHLDAKGEADRFFTEAGVPTTFLRTSFYWDNLIHFGMGPTVAADGSLVLSLPIADAPLAGMAAADIGACALGVLAAGDEFVGRSPGVAGGHLTGAQMAADLAAALGRPVRFQAVPYDVYRGLGFPGAEDLGNMFQVGSELSERWCGGRDVALSRRLHPGLQSFPQWLAAHADAIPLGDPLATG